jgi:hypothetical protein
MQVPAGDLQGVPYGEHLQLDMAVVVTPQQVGAVVAIDRLQGGQDRTGEVLMVGALARGAAACAVLAPARIDQVRA